MFLLLSVNAVTLCARAAATAQPFLGHLPCERCQDHICPHPVGPPAPPSLALPAWDTPTHLPYLSCVFDLLMFRVAHWMGVYLGERGRLVPWGGQRRAGNAWRAIGGSLTPAVSRNSFFSPHPRVPPPPPKEVALVYSEDSVTVSPFPEI